MKKVLLGIAILSLGFTANAQQDPQFTQNMNNKLFPNPGVAGSNGGICATVLGRHQWVGFDGKPETYLLSAHGAIGTLPLGAGLSISQDKLGHQSTLGVKLAVAYRRALGPGAIGIGVGVGMMSFRMDGFTDFNSETGYSDAIDGVSNDPSIPEASVNKTKADFDLGVYYKIPNKLYVGLSSTHLTQSDFKVDEFDYKSKRHYYIMAGYEHELSAALRLLPSVFVKSDGSSAQVDLNAIVEYNNFLWGGVSYRYQDAIAPMIGVKGVFGDINYKVGYSYDVTTSRIRGYSSGTHEIMLNACYKFPDNTVVQKHFNPRFL